MREIFYLLLLIFRPQPRARARQAATNRKATHA